MGAYILKRLVLMVVTIFVIITITFVIMQLLPGSPYENEEKLSPEQIEELNKKYGLDKPVSVQYVQYLGNVAKGDLGNSFQFGGRDVTKVISDRLWVSVQLGIESIVVGVILGLILGVVAALRQGTFTDYGAVILAVLGISIPSFLLAVLLQFVFSMNLEWFPVAYWEGPMHHVLPVLALAVGIMASVARFMRTEMVEILQSDYIVFAKSKGLKRYTVIVKHSIRNALIPIITIIGPMTAAIITGSLVIEKIFAIPGIGQQFVESIYTNDYPVILGTTILYTVAFVIMIFVTDLLYGVVDPRIRLQGGDS
ncbi:MAG TPA: ABC transporter permease [Bacillota bacterium]|nr:ABC transporter permease [Bacillota bacterium]